MCCCCCRCCSSGQPQQTSVPSTQIGSAVGSVVGGAAGKGSVSKGLGSFGDLLDQAVSSLDDVKSDAEKRHTSIAAYHEVAKGADKAKAQSALDAAQKQLAAVQAAHAAVLQAAGAAIVHHGEALLNEWPPPESPPH